MKTRLFLRNAGLAIAFATLGACAQAPSAAPSAAPPAIEAEAQRAPASVNNAMGLPLMIVHKSPSCGCCGSWVEHVRQAGFAVEVREADNLQPVKERLGVPYGKGSCHTAEIAGYMIEGHVPATDIKRLLEEKPDAIGLVLPGMPMGSPGMEMPDGRQEPYTVEIVNRDGTTEPFAQH
ncbi:DUF411 domain-containing protein [Luteimonas notoginsengisoli]|uniref:DUF411 domain-containing protein n=1 Tax=Luteimonas notoginsengisoli TaxID=1578200 RepID=A0ABV7UWS5_9GAMM